MMRSLGTDEGEGERKSMGVYSREEIERAFQHYWQTGAVDEDWEGFADNFAPDVLYVEHVLGTMKGRERVRDWILPIMEEYCELYTAYEWHTIDEEGGRAIVYAAACEQHDPDHKQKRTRNHWGSGPAWTRGAPSWFERPGAKNR